MYLLTALESRSLRSECQRGQVLTRALPWLADGGFLAVSSHGEERERERETAQSCGIRALLSLNLRKIPSPETVTLKVRAATYEFW